MQISTDQTDVVQTWKLRSWVGCLVWPAWGFGTLSRCRDSTGRHLGGHVSLFCWSLPDGPTGPSNWYRPPWGCSSTPRGDDGPPVRIVTSYDGARLLTCSHKPAVDADGVRSVWAVRRRNQASTADLERRDDQDEFDGLVQDCSNSSALAMELLQSCTTPSNYSLSNTSHTVYSTQKKQKCRDANFAVTDASRACLSLWQSLVPPVTHWHHDSSWFLCHEQITRFVVLCFVAFL